MARDIVFVVDRQHLRAGSVHLRGTQLASLFHDVARDYGRQVRVAYAEDLPQDCIAVVHKSALRLRALDVARRLRAQGCVVLMDFIDAPVAPALAVQADGFLACSTLQARHLRAAWPDRPTIHLPHHIDLEVPALPCRWDRYACGYFGDPAGAWHLDALVAASAVVACQPMTLNRNRWHEALLDYPLHYAFRPRSGWGAGFKPFTKGFVAARVGAVTLVASSDAEALNLLGDDYPFQLPDDADAATVLSMLDALRASFGDTIWSLARSRLNRLQMVSSRAYLSSLIRAYFFEDGPFSGFLR